MISYCFHHVKFLYDCVKKSEIKELVENTPKKWYNIPQVKGVLFMKWLQNFMRGRYGVDQLNFFLLILAIVIMVVATIFQIPFVSWISVFLLVLSYFRMFSRNVYKRSAENTKYLRMVYPISSRFKNLKKRWNDRKTHKYLKCPNCKQQMRVPKGKGEITVTCPKCHTKFDAKS